MIKNGSKLLLANQTEAQKAFGEMFSAAETMRIEIEKTKKSEEEFDIEMERLIKERDEIIRKYEEKMNSLRKKYGPQQALLEESKTDLAEKIKSFGDVVTISNDDLVRLLEKQTGKKWKIKIDKRYIGIGDYKVNMYILNEDDKDFASEDGVHGNIDDRYKTGALLLSTFSKEEWLEKDKQEMQETNWGPVYFARKYEIVYLLGQSFRPLIYGPQKTIPIDSVLENYINSLVSNTESDGENE